MRYGLNLLLWTDRMHEGMEPIVARVKEMGYDGVEMPMFELNESLYTDWGKRLDDLGLARTAVSIRTAGDNPISPSASVRTSAVDAPQANNRLLPRRRCQGAGRPQPLSDWRVFRQRPEFNHLAASRYNARYLKFMPC